MSEQIENTENKPLEINPLNLDWKDAEIPLSKGKFKHFFRRPQPEEVVAWQEKLTSEVMIAKDGSIPLVAESAQDEKTYADFYDLIKFKDAEGYDGTPVPNSHKSAAVKRLYDRTIWIDEEANIFAEEITVNEVLGDVNNPIAHVQHILKNPIFDDAKLRRIKNVISGGTMQTDRKGGRKIVPNKPLRRTNVFYFEHCLRLSGVLESQKLAKDLVDPLIQNLIVSCLVRELTDALSD